MLQSMPPRRARTLLGAALAALPWSACAQSLGGSIIQAAPADQPYDYIVHVKNTYGYRYNPEVRDDRISLATQIVGQFCSKMQIVGEAKFKTEIFGLVTGKPDYVVYVKCLR